MSKKEKKSKKTKTIQEEADEDVSEVPEEKTTDEEETPDAPKTNEDEGEDESGAGGKRKRKRKRKKKNVDTEEIATPTEEQPSTGYSQQDSVECTIYVEGIPFDATPDQVKEFFVSNGAIEDIVELRLPTWQDSGRLRGYGHILFGSTDSFEKALELSGKHMGKRYLTIQQANTPRNGEQERPTRPSSDEPPPQDCRTLFLNNLPYHASEDEISAAFEIFGVTIADGGVRIARNSVTRQSKGFCYVDFESPADVQKIMDSDEPISVQGRMVRLDYDTGRMKGSYRAESGRLWTKETQEKKRSRPHKKHSK